MSKIELTGVSRGVYYIEFQGARLKILCGVPADSVKSLIQHEIIKNEIRNGITGESGPNAILLSDISIQNGQPSNLTEFPILQMLYRQGMIIPGHPNKTDKFPIIVGSTAQIISQIEYIYLGNYGIDNIEELMEYNLTREEATELIRLKKRFAFGNFIPSQELIHQCVVKDDFVEIIDEVFIRRLTTNLFEFKYKDERITIDLNLKWNEIYDAPYNLPMVHVNKNRFSIVHSGQGNGWDPVRPCMSSVIVYEGELYLIDTIPNIDLVLKSLGISVNEIAGVFQTHVHDDHFNGITTLMKANRTLKIYTTPLIQHAVIKKLCILLPFREKDIKSIFEFISIFPSKWNNINGLEVRPEFSPHPIETYNMHFRTKAEKGGYHTYSHLADITSLTLLQNYIEEDKNKPGLSRALYDKVCKNYLNPVDLKKIDAGGGDIHGNPYDFKHDKSKSIVFAHTNQPLFEQELLNFGMNVKFGEVDVFDEGNADYRTLQAKSMLEKYFESTPDDIVAILQNPIVVIEPNTKLLSYNKNIEYLYLILSGIIVGDSFISSNRARYSVSYLIGEEGILNDGKSMVEYSTITYVSALKIPATLFNGFIKKHNLTSKIKQKAELNKILSDIRLFSESAIPNFQLAELEDSIKTEWLYKKDFAGAAFDEYILKLNRQNKIFFILDGEINAYINPVSLKIILGKGDCFGENIVFDLEPFYYFELNSNCRIAIIDSVKTAKIPCIFGHIHEIFEKKISFINNLLKKNQIYIRYDQDKHLCSIHSLNNASLKMLFAYNLFEFLFHNGAESFILKRAVGNLIKFFRVFSDIKIKNLNFLKIDNLSKIKADQKKLDETLQKTHKMLNSDKLITKHEIKEIRTVIKLTLLDNSLIKKVTAN